MKIQIFFICDLDDFGGSVQDIEKKYDENVYYLKKGDLETYVGKEKENKFPNAIDFCENRFDVWFGESTNSEKIIELKEIFSNIYSKIAT